MQRYEPRSLLVHATPRSRNCCVVHRQCFWCWNFDKRRAPHRQNLSNHQAAAVPASRFDSKKSLYCERRQQQALFLVCQEARSRFCLPTVSRRFQVRSCLTETQPLFGNDRKPLPTIACNGCTTCRDSTPSYCAKPNSDPSSCGTCNNDKVTCPAQSNSGQVATCTNGQCGVECDGDNGFFGPSNSCGEEFWVVSWKNKADLILDLLIVRSFRCFGQSCYMSNTCICNLSVRPIRDDPHVVRSSIPVLLVSTGEFGRKFYAQSKHSMRLRYTKW